MKITGKDNTITQYIEYILYMYILNTPLVLVLITWLGFDEYIYKFYYLSIFISVVFIIFNYNLFKVNITSITFHLLNIFIVYQLILSRKNVNYEFGLLVQWILMILTLIIFIDQNTINKLSIYITQNSKKMQIKYLIVSVYFLVLYINKIAFSYNWNGNYFEGFFSFNHQTSYYFFLLQGVGIVLFCKSKTNKDRLINSFIITTSLIINSSTGARTTIILSIVILIPFIYKFLENRYRTIIISVLFIIILSMIIINFKLINIQELSIVQKFIHSNIKSNGLFKSREFWITLVEYYKYFYTDFQRLFGIGFGAGEKINDFYAFYGLWSHNDFLEVLLSGGMSLLTYYIYMLFKIAKNSKQYFAMFIILLIAFMNGFFAYAFIVASIPIYIIAFKSLNKQLDNIDGYMEDKC